MKRLNLIIILFFIMGFYSKTCALEIVYPKTNNVKISSPVTFFIGNDKPESELKINNEKVKIHPSGGFYHVVKLNAGENTFYIENSKGEKLVYNIFRPNTIIQTASNVKPITYDNPIYVEIKNNNSPLRSEPSDSGLNRLQHLERGTQLKVIGEYGKFYKIQLARDDYAWIEKSLTNKSNNQIQTFANIISYTYEKTAEFERYNINLSDKVPYILSEKRGYNLINNKYEAYSKGLDLTVYNVESQPENKFELELNSKEKLFGYDSYYTASNELIITIKKIPQVSDNQPLKNIKVTLDPGHGGSEYGAIGCLGHKEKDINLAIALKAKEYLEKKGAIVSLTRNEDSYLGLYQRVDMSKSFGSDIFISIHSNALPDALAQTYRSGASVYYFYPQSNDLARIMLETLTKELATNNDKVRQESFAVIRNTSSPAILIEVGYMINPEDNSKLITPEFQSKAGQAIANGVEKYINDLSK